jgi:hypothetical protein
MYYVRWNREKETKIEVVAEERISCPYVNVAAYLLERDAVLLGHT